MGDLNKLKWEIQQFSNTLYVTPAIKFLTTSKIKNLSNEELKELWVFAKVRFITLHIVGKENVYELTKDGKLNLIL